MCVYVALYKYRKLKITLMMEVTQKRRALALVPIMVVRGCVRNLCHK